jgi:hypothetical protein
MADAPFYSPNRTHAVRGSRPGERLWTELRDGITWSAEIRDDGEFGTEAQILREGELRIGKRFAAREAAVLWAQHLRTAIVHRRS